MLEICVPALNLLPSSYAPELLCEATASHQNCCPLDSGPTALSGTFRPSSIWCHGARTMLLPRGSERITVWSGHDAVVGTVYLMSSDEPATHLNRHENPEEMVPVACTSADAALTGAARTLGPEATISSTARSSKSQSFVEGLKYGVAGGVAGAFAKSCTAPLARLTILYQVQGFSAGQPGQQPPGLRHAFLQVVRREGPAALWKGNLATILHRLPYSSINFYTYEHSNKFLAKQLPPNTDFARSLASGALAGLVACTAAYPLDLVRTRLAAQTQGNYYHGILPTLQRIVADEGAVGLYRGLGATLLQVVPSLALTFSLYDTIRDSCMSVYTKQQGPQHSIQQLQQHGLQDMQASSQTLDNNDSSRKRRRSLLGTLSNAQELAHTLSVASSVDQGTSLAQAAIWHMADQDAQAASRTGQQQASSSAVQQAAAVKTSGVGYDGQQRAGNASAGSSSSNRGTNSSAGAGVSYFEVPAGISLASGCISGFITATVTFPLDVVRRRMQVYGREHHAERASYQQIIQQISQHRGFRGFYVGILPEYCKVVPGVAIAFCTYEQVKKWLQAE